jgi:hypothetical protein
MDIKKFNKVMFRVVLLIMLVAMAINLISYFLIIKLGLEVINKFIN